MRFAKLGANPTSAWRTEVRTAIQRLSDEFALLSPAEQANLRAEQAHAALERASSAVAEPPSLRKWWSGDQVERAWRAVKDAQTNLVLVQSDSTARLRTATVIPAVRSNGSWVAPTPTTNVAALYRTIVAKHSEADQYFVATRQLRNVLWLTTIVLTGLACVALIIDSGHRPYILVGGLAGALTGILPLASSIKLTGPYGVTLAQILLKIPAGAIAALLGIYFLAGGVGSLPAAMGRTAYFYAVLFGLSQQALTSIADSQAKSLAK
jgi:hypothetical protein